MRLGVYPGTFDPVTNGHLDIIERGSKLFDELYVVVSNNIEKDILFTAEERAELIKKTTSHLPNVKVVINSALTVEFAKKIGAKYMLRGLRAISDYEYELALYSINKQLDREIETVFIMSSSSNSYISSSNVKAIAKYGADLTKFVPEIVKEALIKKFQK